MLRLCIDGSVEGILFIFSSTFPLFKSSVMKSLYRFWCRRFSVCTSMLEMERIEFYPNRIDPSWMAVWKMLFPWWSIYSTVVSFFLNLRHKLKTNQMINICNPWPTRASSWRIVNSYAVLNISARYLESGLFRFSNPGIKSAAE
jgi:hypothetical protein